MWEAAELLFLPLMKRKLRVLTLPIWAFCGGCGVSLVISNVAHTADSSQLCFVNQVLDGLIE